MIDRGGKMVEIVKHCAFGVPPIIIGHHLDEASVGTLYCNIEPTQDGEKGLAKRMKSPKWSLEETVWWVFYCLLTISDALISNYLRC